MQVPSDSKNLINQTRTSTLIGILLALFGFLLTHVWELVTGLTVGSVGVAVLKWMLVAGIVLIVLVFEQESLASIGVTRPDRWDVVTGIMIFVLGVLSIGILTPIVDSLGFSTAPFGGDQTGGVDRTATALLVGLLIGVTAGITEEILYRGYALERLETLTGSTWIAATVTAFLFVVVHFGGHSFGALLIITPLTVFLTIGYVWRRNIFVPMIGHVILNGLWQSVTLLMLVFGSL
ncbi:abortive infection protein [Halalkaliarchaeum desulfuricum]|uniref:Abortive infection protein n=1 Tax=Halalkaliarchaeum desulfuricum TaxID=2055893 RepID=A0A343TNG4_9EURY|nr:type II CAAX endopeptidase family protein [Halalkaliarchaeum desulfuricum]AUX10636.1 abortive infection protein [Halalkaliarchaeum desulfuricum]